MYICKVMCISVYLENASLGGGGDIPDLGKVKMLKSSSCIF